VFPGAEDRQVARRLAREARAAARSQAREELAHARLVRRRERRVQRARQRLPVQAVLGVGAGIASFPLDGGLGVAAAVVGAVELVRAGRSISVLRSPRPEPVRALQPAPLPPPPHPRSVVFPAVRRLEDVREELRRLLPLVGPAGREVAEEAWAAAAEADTALRWQAARLAAAEPHRALEPDLLQALEDGVACQEQLVVAVADLVAASADPLASGRLREATDALHGLAQGLREVR
jgi:hypothetical protein